jgi:hypothetical protein
MLRSNSASSYAGSQGSDFAAGEVLSSLHCQQDGVSSDKDTWLHQAAPYNLAEMDDDLLALPVTVLDIRSNNCAAFLYQALPFVLAELNDDLLASSDSMADMDNSWLQQAGPFDLEAMDDDLLGGIF